MSKDIRSELIPRIINHMNKDHKHNLEDYLVVYGHVDQDLASRDPTLESLELGAFTLSFVTEAGGKTLVRIPIEPSMNSFIESKGHFVKLAQEAAQRRGFSEYLVNQVPMSFSASDIVCFVAFALLWYFSARPQDLYYIVNDVLQLSDGTQHLITEYTPSIFKVLVGLHSVEAVLILYPMLRKYRMGIVNKMLALTLCMIEGIFFIQAYKKVIEKATNKNKKAN